MTTAVVGCRLELKSPKKAEVKLQDDLEVVVDLELPDPWFELPALGKRVGSVDGHGSSAAIAFECSGPVEVPALVSGMAIVRDSRIDVHTPQGFPDAGSGRGVELSIRAGALEIKYGHLERGSAKSGAVRAGDAIGRAGNTGRCVDGCGRHFVAVEVQGGRMARTFEDLSKTVEIEAFLEGKSLGRAVRFPEGELKVQGLRVARGRTPKERHGAKTFRLEVKATRGGKPIASETMDLAIRL